MHSVSGFFLIVTFFIIGLSILAVYTTIIATELGLEKDDMQITSLTHLIKSMDWENDYNEEKIGERILKAQLDDLNITLQSNNTQKNVTDLENNLAIYKSHLEHLNEGVTANGSFLNLKHQAESEYVSFIQSADHISDISKKIGIYELITVLLIIAAGLGGVSEITRNKLLGYPAFVIGGIGVILLLVISFFPSTLI